MLSRDEKIDKIYDAVVGNHELRQKGLIEKQESTEKEVQDLKDTRNKLIGGMAVLGGLGSVIVHFILKAFHL